MYEFRRVTDSSSGERAIFLGIDGKAVTDHETVEGVNPDGHPGASERSTLSFDHRVVDFEDDE
jgi:hypothetical protein